MAAIFASANEVADEIESLGDLSLAAANGSHTVISGSESLVSRAVGRFEQRGVRCKRLNTSHAFHSSLLDPILDEWQQVADGVVYRNPTIPMICNVSGKTLPADFVADGEYWRRHLRECVQFSESVRGVAEIGCNVLVEIGPQPILSSMAAACWPLRPPAMTASLDRDSDDQESMLRLAAKLYVHGATPDFDALMRGSSKRRVVLPTYPFQRKRFWGPAKPTAHQVQGDSTHPLLGDHRSLAGVTDQRRYESTVDRDRPHWLGDHRVMGDTVFPGAGYVEMALAAAAGEATPE